MDFYNGLINDDYDMIVNNINRVNVNNIIPIREHRQKLWTPLHLSAWFNYTNISLLLLEHGANVNVSSIIGEIPLMYAIYNRNVDVVESILRHNPNLLLTDYRGNTALHWAVAEEADPIFSNTADIILQMIYEYIDTLPNKDEVIAFKNMDNQTAQELFEALLDLSE